VKLLELALRASSVAGSGLFSFCHSKLESLAYTRTRAGRELQKFSVFACEMRSLRPQGKFCELKRLRLSSVAGSKFLISCHAIGKLFFSTLAPTDDHTARFYRALIGLLF
jgi:hypothetical protein